jgi:hypothetical protein
MYDGLIDRHVLFVQSLMCPSNDSVRLYRLLVSQISRWVRNGAYEIMGPFMAILTSDTVRALGSGFSMLCWCGLSIQCVESALRVRVDFQISPDFLKKFAQIPTLTNAVVDPDITFFCAFNFPGAWLAVIRMLQSSLIQITWLRGVLPLLIE